MCNHHHGYCIPAGLALACDLRVGVPKAKLLGLNFTQLGIHSGMGASHFVRLAVPCSTKATEFLLRGATLSGEEALQWGLLNRLAPVNQAVEEAHALAHDVVHQTHPVALRLMVQTLRAQQNVGLEQALQREAMAQAICYHRNDWGEGLRAVAEKRSPHFDGYFEK